MLAKIFIGVEGCQFQNTELNGCENIEPHGIKQIICIFQKKKKREEPRKKATNVAQHTKDTQQPKFFTFILKTLNNYRRRFFSASFRCWAPAKSVWTCVWALALALTELFNIGKIYNLKKWSCKLKICALNFNSFTLQYFLLRLVVLLCILSEKVWVFNRRIAQIISL